MIRTLKYEEIYLREYDDLENMWRRIGHFLDAVYNAKRRHLALLRRDLVQDTGRSAILIERASDLITHTLFK